MCNSSNTLVQTSTISTTTIRIDQQNKKRADDDKQKELVIGRSKFNQSRRVEQWSCQLKNCDKSAPLQHLPGTLLDPEAIDIPDKNLWEPLLDGGQVRNFLSNVHSRSREGMSTRMRGRTTTSHRTSQTMGIQCTPMIGAT